MLTSNRAVFSRLLRRGDTGEDVRTLQEMLTAAGFDTNGVDGNFGERTHNAVVAFQRSKGLDPDGVAGPLTVAALAQVGGVSGGGSSEGQHKGLSLHIGLNNVDTTAYGFNVPPLAGCINDANDMRAIAVSRGFRPKQLLDAAATATAVSDSIRQAAEQLSAGDIFLITYSGHGAQVADPAEPDQLSETWVLWDRQLIDDELYALWGRFAAGVRVMVISDSCHSGTVTRDFLVTQLTSQIAQNFTNPGPAQPLLFREQFSSPDTAVQLALELTEPVRSMMQAAGVDRPGSVQLLVRNAVQAVTNGSNGNTGARGGFVEVPRVLSSVLANRDRVARAGMYEQVVEQTRSSTAPICSVLLISGCQDNQTSSDGRPDPNGHQNGAFTKQLRAFWQTTSDYADLHAKILQQMPPTQSPNLYWATPRDAAFEAQHPFTI